MKIYAVGGSVRDELLGLPLSDRDYVVVGGTPEEMVRLGYKPVGKDFPVFLHPQTHEEYALARTERKVARGYKGFKIHAAPDVTLEQDLERRDLTINAMARDEDGRAGRSLRRRSRPRAEAAASRERGLRRGSGAHPARRALRGALRLRGRSGDHGADARHGGGWRSRRPRARAVWQEFSRGLMEGDPALMFAGARGSRPARAAPARSSGSRSRTACPRTTPRGSS